MATKYAVASGAWSSTATWSDTDGGAGGAAVPADDDAVTISANVAVLMDADLSAYTGLRTVTIRGHATTPATLYFASGTSGYLKLRTGYNIVGTSGAAKGRLLANSDGVWGHTNALPFANKAVGDLGATTSVVAQYLDIALYCTEPARKWVRVYGTKYDFTASAGTVDVAANTIDLGTPPPAAGTPVMITSAAGVLPAPLAENVLYYVRTVVGNTCKLATQNSDATIVDLTATGSGTCTLFTGHTNTGTATVNVLDDVTADTPWTTAAGHNRCVLVNVGPQSYDQQRLTLVTINPGSLVLSANVDSVQLPGAVVVLASRNVSIRSACVTNIGIFEYTNAPTSGGVLGCEIWSSAGTGTTFYGHGVLDGTGHIVSGVVMGFTSGVNAGTGHTVTGVLVACTYGLFGGVGHTLAGTALGCTYGFYVGVGHTISGSGIVVGCSACLLYGTGHDISGVLRGSSAGVQYGTGHKVRGDVYGCLYNIYCSFAVVITGRLGLAGGLGASTTDFRFTVGDNLGLQAILRAIQLSAALTFSGRNTAGCGKLGGLQGVYSEDHGRVLGASYAYLMMGDVIKNTVIVRTGGASSSLEVVPLSNCAVNAPIRVFEWTELSLPVAAYTKSVYVKGEGWSSFPTAAQLYLEAEYISDAGTLATTIVASTQVLTDNTTWTALSVSFTPAVAGHVRYRLWLGAYAVAAKIYADAELNG